MKPKCEPLKGLCPPSLTQQHPEGVWVLRRLYYHLQCLALGAQGPAGFLPEREGCFPSTPGVSNFCCEGPHGKYLQLCRPHNRAQPLKSEAIVKRAVDNMQINGHGCVPVKLYLHKQIDVWIWPKGCGLLIPYVDPEAALPVPNLL